MRRNAVLLVLLLVAAAGITAPVADLADGAQSAEPRPRMASVNGSANYATLPPSEVGKWGFTRTGIDVSTAFAGDTRQIHSSYATLSFNASFAAAPNQTARTAVLRAAVGRLEARTASLEARNRAAMRGLSNGSLTIEQFARIRAQVQTEAHRLELSRERVAGRAETASGYTVPDSLKLRLVNLEGEILALEGPVSERVLGAAKGRAPPETVYAESSATGYTLAYVDGTRYVRETYRGDQRASDAVDQFASADEPRQNVANSRGIELYPWATNNSVVTPNIFGWGNSGIYRFSVDFQGGDVTAYLDGGTTNVFREAQHRRVTAVPVTWSTTATNGTLEVHVNRTFTTGPMQISVTRAESDTPVSGTVAVDGHEVGQTGADGQLWTVEPRGAVTVNVTSGGERVTVRVPR